jgi:hypothetical protein
MRRWILRRFDLIIGHSRNCQSALQDTFGTAGKKYVLAVHGTYDGLYATSCDEQHEARAALDLPHSCRIVLLPGSGRANKGTEQFLEAWSLANVGGSFLVVTGTLSPREAQLIEAAPNVSHHDGFVDNDTLALLLTAVDAVALPYQAVTTSGMYFLALTFRRPVIAPAIPFFEQHSTESTAILYDASRGISGIADAISLFSDGWRWDPARLDCLAREFSWKRSAAIIADSYADLIR